MAKIETAPDSTAAAVAPRLTCLVVSAAIAAGTVAAFWGLQDNEFVNYDDQAYITRNRHVQQGLTWDGVGWAFTTRHASNWHPLTWLGHMADVELFGMRPAGHHLMNLAIHVVNAIVLLGVMVRMTGLLWPSAFVAGLFALHPLHVESVAWASERKDVLCGFFWLVTIWAYVHYASRPGLARYTAVIGAYAGSLMSKPMAVTLPLLLLLLDYWPLHRTAGFRTNRGLSSTARLMAEKLPLLAMAGVCGLITLNAQRGAVSTLQSVNVMGRLTNAAVSYGRYVLETVRPTRLAVFYPYPRVPQYAEAAAVLVLLAAVTAVALRWRKRLPFVFVGWLWYLVSLLPVIGLIQAGEQSHADRYTYMPLVGLFVIVAWGAAEAVVRRPGLRWVVTGAAAASLLIAGVLTHRQVSYWKDTVSLLERAMAVTDANPVVLTNLGNALMAKGELDRAASLLEQSIKLAPRRAESLSGMGRIMFERGRLSESWEYYRAAVEARPDLKDAQFNAGACLVAMGRFADAEMYLRKAIEIDPVWAEPYGSLGSALAAMGRLDEGLAACKRALELDSGLHSVHFTMGALYAMKGDFVHAVEEYSLCMAVAPIYPVRKNLGHCLLALGRREEAEKVFRAAVAQMPQIAESHYNLAAALDGLGRRAEAIRELRIALEVEPNNVNSKEYLERLLREREQGGHPNGPDGTYEETYFRSHK